MQTNWKRAAVVGLLVILTILVSSCGGQESDPRFTSEQNRWLTDIEALDSDNKREACAVSTLLLDRELFESMRSQGKYDLDYNEFVVVYNLACA